MKLLLFLSSSFLTLLLVVHAVKTRGGRTAFFFFAAAFLFGVVRGNSVAALAAGEKNLPYIFSEALLSIGRAELPACVGWVFALYLSWTLAEGILARMPELGGRVFPLAAFALLAMGCFSDAVETTASGVGWWRWNIISPSTPLLAGGAHLFGIVEWMSVGFDFLVPFLLFRTGRGAKSALAWASLLLYPIHWMTHWKYVTAPGFPHSYELYHAVIAFAIPVFPLLKNPRLAPASTHPVSTRISRLPVVALAGMFAVLLGGATALIPSFAAGDRGREKTLRVAAVAGAMIAFGLSLGAGRGTGVALIRMLPPVLPALCLLVYGCLLAPPRRILARRIYATAVVLAAGVAAAAPRDRNAPGTRSSGECKSRPTGPIACICRRSRWRWPGTSPGLSARRRGR